MGLSANLVPFVSGLSVPLSSRATDCAASPPSSCQLGLEARAEAAAAAEFVGESSVRAASVHVLHFRLWAFAAHCLLENFSRSVVPHRMHCFLPSSLLPEAPALLIGGKRVAVSRSTLSSSSRCRCSVLCSIAPCKPLKIRYLCILAWNFCIRPCKSLRHT